MSLIFGRLGQSFIDFGMILQTMGGGSPTPEQYAAYQEAASNLKSDTAKNALYLVYIGESCWPFCHHAQADFVLKGLGSWLTTYIYMATWALTGERNAKRIRENYLRAILRQDIAYFDTSGGAGEVATRIQSDTRKYKPFGITSQSSNSFADLVQMGTSEKVPCTQYSRIPLNFFLTVSS